jgi:hypothetical protein
LLEICSSDAQNTRRERIKENLPPMLVDIDFGTSRLGKLKWGIDFPGTGWLSIGRTCRGIHRTHGKSAQGAGSQLNRSGRFSQRQTQLWDSNA